MAKKKEKTLAEFQILFPKAPRKGKDRKVLFNKFLSLVEESKESLLVEVKTNKRRKQVVLDSDEFMFLISFRKILSTKILVNDPEKNITTVNEVGNKVINYMNTILGDKATNSRVRCSKTTTHYRKTVNVCKKLLGEARLAKLSEAVEQPLKPIGIFMGYELKGRDISFATATNKRSGEILFCSSTYKDQIPFNFLRQEYDGLNHPAEIVKKLSELEL